MKAFYDAIALVLSSIRSFFENIFIEKATPATIKAKQPARKKTPAYQSSSCKSLPIKSSNDRKKFQPSNLDSDFLDDEELAASWTSRIVAKPSPRKLLNRTTRRSLPAENTPPLPVAHWTEREMDEMRYIYNGTRSQAGQLLHSLICSYSLGDTYIPRNKGAHPRKITKDDITIFAKAHPEALKDTSINGYSHLHDILNFTSRESTSPAVSAHSSAPPPLSIPPSTELTEIMSALYDPLSPPSKESVLTKPGNIAGRRIKPKDYLRAFPKGSDQRNWLEKRIPSHGLSI